MVYDNRADVFEGIHFNKANEYCYLPLLVFLDKGFCLPNYL